MFDVLAGRYVKTKRLHNDKQVGRLCARQDENGFRRPISARFPAKMAADTSCATS